MIKPFEVLKIPLTNPYYAHKYYQSTFKKLVDSWNKNRTNLYDQGGVRMKLVNEAFLWDRFTHTWKGNMSPNQWYLLPEAFSLHLKKK